MNFYNSTYQASSDKFEQIYYYVNQLNYDNIIFVGDSNMKHPLLGDTHSNIMGNNLINILDQNDYIIYNNQGIPTHKQGGHMDLIMGTPDLPIKQIHIRPQWLNSYHILSDHYPITFTYDIQSDPIPIKTYKIWNLNSKHWPHYNKISEKIFGKWIWKFHSLNDNYNALVCTWKRIAHSTIGTKTISDKPHPWWTNNIRNLIQDTKKYKRIINKRIKKIKKQNSLFT